VSESNTFEAKPRGADDAAARVVGILAVQGAFEVHARAVRELGYRTVFVRSPSDLENVDGLILPGGESTVQLDLLSRLGLERPLCAFVERGAPVLATCAGLILIARAVRGPEQRSLGFVDVTVERNAWGRQVESFEATSDRGRELVFIRAPRIVELGPDIEVLDSFEGEPVLIREGNITCATFHPELTSDREIHRRALARPRFEDRKARSDSGACVG
jgi:5'-phosphate synthase pdxT subunit